MLSLSLTALSDSNHSKQWPASLQSPDATATFNLNGAAPTDAALRALLGTAPGKLLRVGPEHILSAVSVGTGLDGGTAGVDKLLVWDRAVWLAARSMLWI